ncbi:hypothetical protein [Arthrobacter globiformis]|uniref:hypothetical protein n=1 Tax=Arthrobacter globiformis TaxID=1665 RepID=UPI001C0EFC51|nr:hypothetical protein [Arthrobacter globiformis]
MQLLSLPEQWRSTANALSGRKGKIYGIRPVFRALGERNRLANRFTPNGLAKLVAPTEPAR